MGFAFIGAVTAIGSCLLIYRRAVEERIIRWKLYQLRDELRLLAYNDVRVRNSAIFKRLDRNFTAHCAALGDVSLWSLLPVIILDVNGRKQADELQRQLAPELRKFPEVERLFTQSASLLMRHLLWRHMFMTLTATLTLIGLLPVWFCTKWASERIVSGALKPVLPVSGAGTVHAHAK